jgi:hypothetical protein
MKVICHQLLSHDSRGTLETSSWVTIGAEYDVVSLAAYGNGRIELQLLTDDGHNLGWFDAAAFSTSDESIPDNWVSRIREGGSLQLAPRPWLAPGFWEDYHDGDAAAIGVVEVELSKMLGKRMGPDWPDLSVPLQTLDLRAAARQLANVKNTDPWKVSCLCNSTTSPICRRRNSSDPFSPQSTRIGLLVGALLAHCWK